MYCRVSIVIHFIVIFNLRGIIMYKSRKKTTLNFGIFDHGHFAHPQAGTIVSPVIELNGFAINPQSLSPRTTKFFEKHGAHLSVEENNVKMVGGRFVKGELEKFKIGRENENILGALNNLTSDIEISWKLSKKAQSFWIRLESNDALDSCKSALAAAGIVYKDGKVKDSDDHCVYIDRQDALALADYSGATPSPC